MLMGWAGGREREYPIFLVPHRDVITRYKKLHQGRAGVTSLSGLFLGEGQFEVRLTEQSASVQSLLTQPSGELLLDSFTGEDVRHRSPHWRTKIHTLKKKEKAGC